MLLHICCNERNIIMKFFVSAYIGEDMIMEKFDTRDHLFLGGSENDFIPKRVCNLKSHDALSLIILVYVLYSFLNEQENFATV